MPLALASGGKRGSKRWRPPTRSRNGGGRLVEFLLAIGREAPCGPSGRFRVCARMTGGGLGEELTFSEPENGAARTGRNSALRRLWSRIARPLVVVPTAP